MADNRSYQRGVNLDVDTSDAVAPNDPVESGDPMLLASLPAVALTDADSAGTATVQIGEGVFRLSVTGAVTAIGQPVYISSAGALTRTTTDDLFGFAMATKGATAAVIDVKLAAQSDNVASA